MRKIVVGVFIGFALSFAVGAHAEVVNMIGKTIDGAFPVKVSGQQLEQTAITVEGTSYLPVRAIGDALNMDVTFNADLGIELKAKGGSTLTTTPRRQTIFPENPPLSKSEEIESKIQSNKTRQEAYNNFLRMEEDNATRNLAPEIMAPIKSNIAKYRAELDKLKAELVGLEKQKAELQNQP